MSTERYPVVVDKISGCCGAEVNIDSLWNSSYTCCKCGEPCEKCYDVIKMMTPEEEAEFKQKSTKGWFQPWK